MLGALYGAHAARDRASMRYRAAFPLHPTAACISERSTLDRSREGESLSRGPDFIESRAPPLCDNARFVPAEPRA